MFEGKIVGGRDVNPGQKPYMASLRHKNLHFCTAFLISINELLTTARCLLRFFDPRALINFDDYTVSVGSLDLLQEGASHGIEKVEISKKFKYKTKHSPCDIGHIKVNI